MSALKVPPVHTSVLDEVILSFCEETCHILYSSNTHTNIVACVCLCVHELEGLLEEDIC